MHPSLLQGTDSCLISTGQALGAQALWTGKLVSWSLVNLLTDVHIIPTCSCRVAVLFIDDGVFFVLLQTLATSADSGGPIEVGIEGKLRQKILWPMLPPAGPHPPRRLARAAEGGDGGGRVVG